MGRLIIKAGRLVDGTGAPAQENMALVARGRNIESIVPLAALQVVPDDQVIDAGDKTVLPGLIDAHVHIRTGKRERLEAQFVTTTARLTMDSWRNCWTTMEMGYTSLRDMACRDYADVALRNAFERGDLVGPRLRVSGQGLSMWGGHMHRKARPEVSVFCADTGICNTPDEARAAARYQISRGADIVKLNTSGTEFTEGTGAINFQELDLDMIIAAVEQAKKVGRLTASHCHGGEGAMNTIIGGVKTIEHGHFLNEAHFEEMLQRDTIVVPTWCVNSLAYYEWKAGQSTPGKLEWLLQAREAKFRGQELAMKMGVKIAAGSDAGFAQVHHGLNARELEFLVEGGMTPLQAIKATTSMAAETMNLHTKMGSLKPGFWCDAVVVDGDPLADIKVLNHKQNILTVIKDGSVVIDRRQR